VTTATTTTDDTQKLPKQIPFIIGNEICERFSFYGMRVNLTAFLAGYLLLSQYPIEDERNAAAKQTFHLFMMGVYFFPLLGGYLADRFLGKYRTILYLSLVYCLGHVCLALFEDSKTGFFAGLALISLGSGGIKPCVSSMVGDQFDEKRKHLASKVFGAFYWSINFGSFFASLLMPITLKKYGPAVAFGIPGILMFIATIVFWLGNRHYVKVPPTGGDNPDSFMRIVWTKLTKKEPADQHHPKEAVEGVHAVFRLLVVFLFIPFFWMLFDQKASTWVLQANKMDREVFGITIEASQMQVINPALVMLLIPLLHGVIYPRLKAAGHELKPIWRMAIGMGLGAGSYVVAGLIQVPMDAGQTMNIMWQLAPYVLLTIAEVMVSVTGLEFAYSKAPRSMKSTIMSLWNVNVMLANLVVAATAGLKVFSGASLFFIYAGISLLAAIGLGIVARRYKMVEYYQKA
jgi:POT family proton-dependent oligopeptide transporter